MTSPGIVNADVSRISDAANAVLDAVRAAALDLGVNLPTEQYLTSGAAVFDCPQVVVTVTGVRTGLPSAGNFPTGGLPGGAAGGGWCAPPWTLDMTIEIVRPCAPTAGRSGTILKSALTKFVGTTSADAAVLMAVPTFITETWANMDISLQLAPIEGGFLPTRARIAMALS